MVVTEYEELKDIDIQDIHRKEEGKEMKSLQQDKAVQFDYNVPMEGKNL